MSSAPVGRGLKAFNYVLIYAYATAHFLLAYYVLLQAPLPNEPELKTLGAVFGGASVASVFVIILVELIGRAGKDRLVALRWNDAQPACRAFTIHIHEDPRINKVALSKRYGTLPALAHDQNALWYKLLRTNRAEEEVLHSHGRSLLFRDLTWVALAILLIAGLASLRAQAVPPALVLLGSLVSEFLLLRWIAKRASIDLVKTVLAVESTREETP